MPDNPFSDPEINDQIKAKILRLQAASLEWDDNPDGRSFDDFVVETLVEGLNAHAEPYLRKVDSEDLISQYGEYMRGVGSALVRGAQERGLLSDPYSEGRLREMAENSGRLMNRVLFLEPEKRESEIQKEVEQVRAQLTPEAVEWHRWRSQMRSRIEARFEASYRRWQADAIERLRNRGIAEGAMANSPENIRAARQKPPLEAVAKDEERRETAKHNLVRALQSYINKLDKANARDAHRETEIFCDYARENYASRAEAYLEAMSPTDPRVLFEVGDLTERRDLSGLPTIGDVLELVKGVKVQRPEHWPDPEIYREGDSLEMRGVLRDLIGREHESFEWLLEEPCSAWFRPQIRDCVNECVRAKREEYELRFPAPPEAESGPQAVEEPGSSNRLGSTEVFKAPARPGEILARERKAATTHRATTPDEGGLKRPLPVPPMKDEHVALLETILGKGPTTLEKWASKHKFGRTTVFDWKAARVAGKSLKGKVSESKIAAIEGAIEDDAKALGLATRTRSD
jgi:hypothetical protein